MIITVTIIIIQFQARGTPHAHCLIFIERKQNDITEESMTSKDIHEVRKVKDAIKLAIQANIQYNYTDSELFQPAPNIHFSKEEKFNWREETRYFDNDYATDPRRSVFNPNLDYSLDENGNFNDSIVHNLFYQHQIANQTHFCCFTCWKYSDQKKCRFFYPWEYNENPEFYKDARIIETIDFKSRKRTRIYPARNNAWINNCARDPLLTIIVGGNMDLQLIINKHAAAIYACSYVSKHEQPDYDVLRNLFIKKMSYYLLDETKNTDKNRLRAVADAVINSQKVGTVQCVQFLMGLKFVKSSREVVTINPLKLKYVGQSLITEKIQLINMNEYEPAYKSGINSNFGKRKAYGDLCKYQHSMYEKCNITLDQMISNYTFRKNDKKNDSKHDKAPFIDVDMNTGLVIQINKKNLSTFQTTNYVFTERKIKVVTRLSPYKEINENDEESCYMILLVYLPWTSSGNESDIYYGFPSAIEKLKFLKLNNQIPKYLTSNLERIQNKDNIINNIKNHPEDVEPLGHDNDEHNDLPHASNNHDDDNNDDDNNANLYDIHNYNSDDEHANIINHHNNDNDSDEDNDNNQNENTFQNVGITILQKSEYDKYKNFINICLTDAMQKKRTANTTNIDSTLSLENKHYNPKYAIHKKQPFGNQIEREKLLNESLLTLSQYKAFITVKDYLDKNDRQLLQIISGEGGTGKTKLIKVITEYQQLAKGLVNGLYGSVVCSAPSGIKYITNIIINIQLLYLM